MSPSLPEARRLRADETDLEKSRLCETPSFVPVSPAAVTMAAASASSRAIGFSTNTWIPRLMAAMEISA